MRHNVIECTGTAFRGLTNRYTGEPAKVFMTLFPGRPPLFFADTYDPSKDMYPTGQEAHDAWSRKDGVAGLRTGAPVCAYTGEPLVPVSTPAGHCFRGGFSPRTPQTREALFAGFAGRKAGPETHVEPAREEAPAPRSHAPELDRPVEDAVRALVDGPKKKGRR